MYNVIRYEWASTYNGLVFYIYYVLFKVINIYAVLYTSFLANIYACD